MMREAKESCTTTITASSSNREPRYVDVDAVPIEEEEMRYVDMEEPLQRSSDIKIKVGPQRETHAMMERRRGGEPASVTSLPAQVASTCIHSNDMVDGRKDKDDMNSTFSERVPPEEAAAAVGAALPKGSLNIEPLPPSSLSSPPSLAERRTPVNAEARIRAYEAAYVPEAEVVYQHVLGVINPASGERAASTVVRRTMLSELGAAHVVILAGPLFADPRPLRQAIKEQAVIYRREKLYSSDTSGGGGDGVTATTIAIGSGTSGSTRRGGASRRSEPPTRGTVIVSGGDGTVEFVMHQIDLVRAELESELGLGGGGNTGSHHYKDKESNTDDDGGVLANEAAEDDSCFVVPAVAPLPLGTGNDFSRCMGFGRGFTPYTSGAIGSLCCCLSCCCGERAVAPLLREAAESPCVRFDRWNVSMVPLHVAQRHLKSYPAPAAATCSSREEKRGESLAATHHHHRHHHFDDDGDDNADGKANPAAPAASAQQRPVEPFFANTIYHVDWEAIYAAGACTTRSVMNYLGIGFDAYVACKFDETRKSYPALCSNRTQNKAMYGVMAIKGAMKIQRIRKLIPMICAPSPWPISATTSSDGAGGSSVVRPPTTTMFSEGKPLMVPLQLPTSSKALAVTNVNSYAGGRPWTALRSGLYYRPVDIVPGSPVLAKSATAYKPPIVTPVAINDRKFEVQAMGGMLHYGTLGMGITSTIKMAQMSEMFVFVLCTPQDLTCEVGQCSAFTRESLKRREEGLPTNASARATLSVQIDGEALPRIAEATILHVRPILSERVYVRCRNPDVVRQSALDEHVHVIIR